MTSVSSPGAAPHALNCALLIPVPEGVSVTEVRRCTCRQLPSANSPEGRKHHVGCRRITSAGKYDASQECDCPQPKRLTHNHGPDEGRGLNCPEYELSNGDKVGYCVLTADDREELGFSSSWPNVKRRALGLPEAGAVSPVYSADSEDHGGEVRTTSATGGQKGVKEARYDLIPPGALELLAIHYGKGSQKYSDHNWRKGFNWSNSYAALNRHLQAFWGGEDLDPETGSPHMAAVAWHAFTLLTFMQEQPQYDDRFKKES